MQGREVASSAPTPSATAHCGRYPNSDRRIGSYNQKIGVGFEAAVARARRQYRDVSRRDHHLMAVLASQHQPSATAGEAENLVSGGMIVMKVIHTIPPLRGPSVLTELGL